MAKSMPPIADLLDNRQRILVTGGAGFIGGAVVRRLLKESNAIVFNLDKMGYASNLTSIKEVIEELGDTYQSRHYLQIVDLTDIKAVQKAVRIADPDLVIHLAAESHVDRSISSPDVFIESNIIGTYNLLKAVRSNFEQLSQKRRQQFRLHHISTDEVFGSLENEGQFSEITPYYPRSPYSASKAASDHLVRAWHHTYGLPVVLTNCSNNYGPWQFPEKLIPVAILKAIAGDSIPLYGDGLNIRDWLYVEDHVDALLLVACQGTLGRSYCIGGYSEKTNKDIVTTICAQLDKHYPDSAPHAQLIKQVTDRPGHDRRYAIDSSRISSELGWKPRHTFEEGLARTIAWYLLHQDWCKTVNQKISYSKKRLRKQKLTLC
ncbi:dTDP-glucose 4,6-dehydratase [Synechococcus sp. M16CYN]|uniref:dTDP-glucose 4,6-dehydratase n=1 Tax=Synechococcus sp. M16CYN TaxID=3103139 RepID=UPI0032536CA7